MTFKDKILIYLYNQSSVADEDYNEHLNYFRYHKLDEVDLIEILIKKVRKDTLNQVLRDIVNINTTVSKSVFKDLLDTNNET